MNPLLRRFLMSVAPKQAKILFAISASVYLMVFAVWGWIGYKYPLQNYDMVFYVGTVYAPKVADSEQLYQRSMEDLKQVVSPAYYKEITEKDVRSNTPAAFAQQMPFYTVKPVYVYLVKLAHDLKLTETIAEATWVVAVAALLLMGVVLFCWRPANLSRAAWLACISALMTLGSWPAGVIARYSCPDSLQALLILLAFIGWVKWRSLIAFLFFAILAILSRAEAVILLAMLVGLFWLMGDEKRRLSGLAAIMAAIVLGFTYVANNSLHGAYSWSIHFYYSFISKLADPGTTDIQLTLTEYLFVLQNNLSRLGADARLFPIVLLSALAVFCFRMKPAGNHFWLALLFVSWANYAVRLLLFPAWDEFRYYYINWMLILMAAAELVPPYFRELAARSSKNSA